LEASDIKGLKELEHENSKLKRLYADRALENPALKDLIGKSSEDRRTPGSRAPFGDGELAPGSASVSGGRSTTIGLWSIEHSAMPRLLRR